MQTGLIVAPLLKEGLMSFAGTTSRVFQKRRLAELCM
jgi:hypothetical protein